MAALTGAVCLEDNGDLCVHRRKLYCEPRDSSCEMCNGGAFTRHGRQKVCNRVDRLLVEVPVVRVCGGVVRGAVWGTCIVLNKEAPPPVGGGKKNF